MTQEAFIAEVAKRAKTLRWLRDDNDWPEPRTAEELRQDPRYRLRNRLDGSVQPEDLVIAAALLLMIAEDHLD